VKGAAEYMFAHRFVFTETEKCFRNAIFTHNAGDARNVQYSLVSSEASVRERCNRVDVRPPFCFPRNREMLQTRDDDQLSEISQCSQCTECSIFTFELRGFGV
jgi:hypothetical protein